MTETDWRLSGQVAPRPNRVSMASERHALKQGPVRQILQHLPQLLE